MVWWTKEPIRAGLRLRVVSFAKHFAKHLPFAELLSILLSIILSNFGPRALALGTWPFSPFRSILSSSLANQFNA